MFEADTAKFLRRQGFKLKKIWPAFSGGHTGTIGGGETAHTPPHGTQPPSAPQLDHCISPTQCLSAAHTHPPTRPNTATPHPPRARCSASDRSRAQRQRQGHARRGRPQQQQGTGAWRSVNDPQPTPPSPRDGWQMQAHDRVPNNHSGSVRHQSQRGNIFGGMS